MSAGDYATTVTGNQNVDALLFGTRWSSTSLTYTFPISASYYPASYECEPGHFDTRTAHFLPVTPQLADAFRAATRQYEAVSRLTFTEVGSSVQADLTAARAAIDFTADARFPTWANEGDIWFNATDYDRPTRSNFAWVTVLHEIGHTLGLKHGHQNNHGLTHQALTPDRDSMEFSVMTYRSHVEGGTGSYTNESSGYAQTLMMYDIAAIQHLYGANFTTRAGNDVYRFSPNTGEMFINGVGQGGPGSNRIFRTIWDGNGIDTYDFSNYSAGMRISLAPGGWSLFSAWQRADLGDGSFARANIYNALQFGTDQRSLIENAIGGAGSDTISGNQAANTLQGNAGNDALIGQGGNDRLYGGNGNDVLRGDFLPTKLGFGTGYVTLAAGTANNSLQTARDLTGNFTLTPDPDIADATNVPHTSVNATGNGRAAFYRIELTEGMTVTLDIDHAVGFDSYVQMRNAAGVPLSGNDDNGVSDPGSKPYAGRTQDSRLAFTVPGTGTYYVAVGTFDGATGGFAASVPAGATYALNISVAMLGHVGNDLLFGGAGNDQLHGDAGNDLLVGGAGADRLYGGTGIDTASYYAAAGGVTVSLASPATNAGEAKGDLNSSIENLSGSAYGDRLFGNAAANALDGSGGNDLLTGGAGADRLVGGAGRDTASYATSASGVSVSLTTRLGSTGDAKGDTLAGIENLIGSGHADRLAGDAGNNVLRSYRGADHLWGGSGNDVLFGGADNDTLSGGSGADQFVFDTFPNALSNTDRITDFYVPSDTIRLENAVFPALRTTGLLPAAQFFKSNAGVAHDADDRIIYDIDSGALFYDANGSAAGGAILFARVGTHLALTHADFFVI
ncbi:M10 family metallopeptidase C-terminal domain-containing protein [Mesorhizobium sp. L-8-3]|uniref:M10 family metallopeptidase C-terminal domain-containing protein n=1 Tax=Mesorhizobium sp. L-8-3 TaxID=2744522 RepID=UPI0019264E48|nr:M10 family metallopeptidase C-terminal domain-containing protein [Mesorhizobium sp. L-8-3]